MNPSWKPKLTVSSILCQCHKNEKETWQSRYGSFSWEFESCLAHCIKQHKVTPFLSHTWEFRHEWERECLQPCYFNYNVNFMKTSFNLNLVPPSVPIIVRLIYTCNKLSQDIYNRLFVYVCVLCLLTAIPFRQLWRREFLAFHAQLLWSHLFLAWQYETYTLFEV